MPCLLRSSAPILAFKNGLVELAMLFTELLPPVWWELAYLLPELFLGLLGLAWDLSLLDPFLGGLKSLGCLAALALLLVELSNTVPSSILPVISSRWRQCCIILYSTSSPLCVFTHNRLMTFLCTLFDWF